MNSPYVKKGDTAGRPYGAESTFTASSPSGRMPKHLDVVPFVPSAVYGALLLKKGLGAR
jgi:hypothetical protein